jgi:hypothetical protein
MQRPYNNEYNLFGQVAIESIKIMGDILPPQMLNRYNAE